MAIEPPSAALAQHLRSLKLATDGQLRACQRHLRNLVRDLPAFDSVWIDALIQEGVLTPFQGRLLSESPESLRRGQFILVDRLPHDGWPVRYQARSLDGTRQVAIAELALHEADLPATRDRVNRHLMALQGISHRCLCLSTELIDDPRSIGVVSPLPSGEPLDDLFVRRGRFPADVVEEIARQLLDGLARLEQAGTLHGDIRMRNLLLSSGGRLLVINSGVLAAAQPQISIHSTLPIACYHGVAPELIGGRSERTPATEMYAVGCLLWHLLAGRPPYLSADRLEQLAAHQGVPIPDVRTIAPETPSSLAAFISRLVARHPTERYRNLTAASAECGASQARGRAAVTQFQVSRQSMVPIRLGVGRRFRRQVSLQGTLTAAVLLSATLLFVAPDAAKSLMQSAGRMLHATQESNVPADQSERPAGENGPSSKMVEAAPELASSGGLSSASPSTSPKGTTSGSDDQRASTVGFPPVEAVKGLVIRETQAHSGIIVLDKAGPYDAAGFASVAELRISGEANVRPVIEISDQPLRLSAPRVFLENVVIRRRAGSPSDVPLIEVDSQQVTLKHCELYSGELNSRRKEVDLPGSEFTSVRWRHLDEKDIRPGMIEVTDCQFVGGGAVFECETVPQIVRVNETACLGTGTLCEIRQSPSSRVLNLSLHGATLRQTGPVVREHRLTARRQTPIEMDLSRCVLDLAGGRAVVEGVGTITASWRPHVRIDSSNSYLSSHAEYMGRRTEAGGAGAELIPIDPSVLEIDGLLPAQFEFSGPLASRWEQNVVVRYASDVQSDEIPGITVNRIGAALPELPPNHIARPPIRKEPDQP